MDWFQPISFVSSYQVTIQPDTQYNVFSTQVKYIMLCMDLWRLREYPVDKLLFEAEKRTSKAFRWIDLLFRRFTVIKKYY